MPRFDSREVEAVNKVIVSGKLSRFFQNFRGGENVRAFEREFAEYLGVKHAISVCNGTVSLETALTALGVGRGDQVITTSLSFIATATAILRVGASPVFVDIEPDTLNIDPFQIEDAITKCTKAILPVSLCGMPVAMPQIMSIAQDHDLPVLEDAAQSLGASIGNYKIGSFGNLASFSFQETKSLTTLGEGGMIVTDDDELAEKCRHIRNHGNVYGDNENFKEDLVCTNLRMTEAAAAFGRVQLSKLDMFNKTQIENAEYFLSHLPRPLSPVYRKSAQIHPIYLLMPVIANDVNRDDFIEYLKEKNISKGVPGQNVGYYKSLIYDAPIFHPYYRVCLNAEWARDNVMVFDIHRWKPFNIFQLEVEMVNNIIADYFD